MVLLQENIDTTPVVSDIPARHPASKGHDRTTLYLALVASLVSIGAFVWFYSQGMTLNYFDSISHLEIARRVIDSPTTGFGQLGGVWLPLPHLLMLPTIGIDALYYSGIAGSSISMVSFVVTTLFIYKIIFHLIGNGRKLPGLVGAGVFMANVNMLYMQSTPMTELLLFACMAAMVYYVQRWIQTDRWSYLLIAGAASLLGSLTRYEAWVLLVTLICVIVYALWRKHYSWEKAEGILLAFLFFAVVGIIGWLVWNQLIFNNFLNWENGPYAKSTLWVGESDTAVGNWGASLLTYAYAIVDSENFPIVCVAALSVPVFIIRERLRMHIMPVLSLLVFIPFFVYAIESGQRPLHVLELNGGMYNVRFGLLMSLFVAIVIGYTVDAIHLPVLRQIGMIGAVSLALVASGVQLQTHSAQIINEPQAWLQSEKSLGTDAAGTFMAHNYNGGKILATFFNNEDLLFVAEIPLRNNIYEGSFKIWPKALVDPPGSNVRWIIMRHNDSTDPVYAALHDAKVLKEYAPVFRNKQYDIYERGQ